MKSSKPFFTATILAITLFVWLGVTLLTNTPQALGKRTSLVTSYINSTDTTIKDIEGRIYKTVKIGNQTWMAENLDVTKFRNGDPIPEAKTDEEWKKAGENMQPAWCYYNNDTINRTKYGKLYNWYAVNDRRGLAPEGYHIPSDAEWTIIEKYLGTDREEKIKSTVGWVDSIGNGTNSSGFTGSPGGVRHLDGRFLYLGEIAWWWSSTERDSVRSWGYNLEPPPDRVFGPKRSGFSVRCLSNNTLVVATDTTLLDIEERIYKTTNIGNQLWMAENLNVSKFRNGDTIMQVTNLWDLNYAQMNNQPAWCYYDNNTVNGERYGKLYNWSAVSDPRGLAPVGWHIPSESEWRTLVVTLGGDSLLLENTWPLSGDTIATKKMKSTENWFRNIASDVTDSTILVPNDGTNESGFNAIAGGSAFVSGCINQDVPNIGSDCDFVWACFGAKYSGAGEYGCWWSQTLSYINDIPFCERLGYQNSAGEVIVETQRVMTFSIQTEGSRLVRDALVSGYSVRCIKD